MSKLLKFKKIAPKPFSAKSNYKNYRLRGNYDIALPIRLIFPETLPKLLLSKFNFKYYIF